MIDLEHRIRERNDAEAGTRLAVHAFVLNQLDAILSSSGPRPAGRRSAHTDTIWVYWAQGERTMPPIVSACVRELRRRNPASAVVLLDDATIGRYVDIPSWVYDRIFDNKTHFSDILRVSLLARYGGIWVDATCLCVANLHDFVAPKLASGFLAYARNPDDTFMLSSWFMAADPGSVIPTLLRDALYVYWRTRTTLEHYFLIHFLFEALHNLHRPFREQWAHRAPLDAYEAHRLQLRLTAPFDAGKWAEILAASTVHKLTYKLPDADLPVGSFCDHLLRWTQRLPD
ncbi:MAG TPA: capsular polysaccharide synthesis protein [Vicinamibacterales bacterium]